MSKKREGYDFWINTLKRSSYVVAPMVDQSELAWRLLSRRHGAHLCYTPMYHAASFVKDPQYRSDALQSCEEDRPLIIQFCANNVDTFVQAALLAQDHCDAIDLNLGCPQAIARRGHYGAFLQDEWDLLKEMVSACHEKLKVPITCKVRVFESMEKTIEYAKMLENAGCQLITVHGRTREQKGPLTGIASWTHIKAVKENVKIPVFANGNIQYLPDVVRCMEETGVDGVMTAEGNLHNPALFEGHSPPVWEMGEEYLKIVEQYPCPMSYIRGHIFKMFHHVLLRHTDFRDQLSVAKNVESVSKVVQGLKVRIQGEIDSNSSASSDVMTDQNLPYWVCQPYVRPSPEEAKKRQEMCAAESRKRQANQETENGKISRKLMKRMKRYPHRNFETRGKEYEPCTECKNPRGMKCEYQMCRPCCKRKMWTEKLDCIGHGIQIKTKLERRLAQEKMEQEQE